MAIPTPIVRHLEQGNIMRTMAIDLSDNPEDRAHIIEVLRSKLYSDKILAPIREYGTNGADAHVEAGIENVPIKITLPSSIFPELRIRDFGAGLTELEIESIYLKYGRSTKRTTNSQAGQLGLGCKSGFCYGDSFMVISYKDGVMTTYNLTISGVCTVFVAEPMLVDDKNGIEIIIPVKQGDVREFQNKAFEFFKYWKICPDIVGGEPGKIEELRGELSKKPLFCDEDWEIRPNREYSCGTVQGVAVMGNIPYPLNWDLISNKMNIGYGDKNEVLFNFIKSNKTILRFNIGDLDFAASRESLEYTEKTCKTVLAKIQHILDSVFKILESKILEAKSYWDAMVIYNQIFGRDEDMLFQGDVYKLEKYYQGKFVWNGIKITAGAFEHLEWWDQENGYSEGAAWKNINGQQIYSSNPVFTVYEKVRSKVKQRKADSYSNNRIPANNKVKILIHDLEKPSLIKSTVRYIFEQDVSLTKVYMLRFKDSNQLNEFVTQMHFESAPAIYVSSIILKVKTWLKQGRVSDGKSTSYVREPQTVRCFTPTECFNKYGWQKIDWGRTEVDLHEEEGLYVDFVDGTAHIHNVSQGSVATVSHFSNVIFRELGEPVQTVYGIPEKNRKSKWFPEAVEDGQWTKLENYFKGKEETILYGRSLKAAIASKFFKQSSEYSLIGINFAVKILPYLTNKKGVMYKVCSQISGEFRELEELVTALKFFKMDDELQGDIDVDFCKLTDEVFTAYPMIHWMDDLRKIQNNSKTEDISKELLQVVSQYVNMIDALPVKKLSNNN